ncbi:MAG: hypothetical protein HYZ26_11750 [Chloroflexi bacterium]|nr:hypothetical protein [Chloroflexota bacterium]
MNRLLGNQSPYIRWPVVATLGFLVLVGVSVYYGQGSEQIIDDYPSYSFDPDTILTYLRAGEGEGFAPIEFTDAVSGCCIRRPQTSVVFWDTATFLELAEWAHLLAWGEPLEGWNLEVMTFELKCDEAQAGPQRARLLFSNVERNRFRFTTSFSEIVIRANSGIVTVHRETYSPYPDVRPSIDLDRLLVTAETALEMVEVSGGAESRASVEENCEVLMVFNPTLPEGYNDGWEVIYYDYKRLTPYIEYLVNAYDGTISGPYGRE